MNMGWLIVVGILLILGLLIATRGTAFFNTIVVGIAGALGSLWGVIRRNPFWAILAGAALIIIFFYAVTFVGQTLRARTQFGRAVQKFWTCVWTGERCPDWDWNMDVPDDYDDSGGDDEESYDDSDDDGDVDDGDDEDSDGSSCKEIRHVAKKGVAWKLTGPASAEIWTNGDKTPWGRAYGQDIRKVLVKEGKTIRVPSGGGVAYRCQDEEDARVFFDENPYPEGDIDLID